METYVRTHLLPYDFSLTAEQEADLFAEVRTILQGATDDELFSVVIRHMMEELVDVKVQPWREENRLNNQLERVKEIRDAAVDYVAPFLAYRPARPRWSNSGRRSESTIRRHSKPNSGGGSPNGSSASRMISYYSTTYSL